MPDVAGCPTNPAASTGRSSAELACTVIASAVQLLTGELLFRLTVDDRQSGRPRCWPMAVLLLLPVLLPGAEQLLARLLTGESLASVVLFAALQCALRWPGRAAPIDYGTGMAHSYFHGYLRLVLPARGDCSTAKGLAERIADYESSNGVRMPIGRLLVLVPDSLYVPDTLKTRRLIECGPLETLRLNRAGCRERTYHQSVYRLDDARRWYAVVEGATPLRTMYEAMQARGGARLAEQRAAIRGRFVHELRRLLRNDAELRDLCEVVTFADRDADDRPVDYGDVVEAAIERLLN